MKRQIRTLSEAKPILEPHYNKILDAMKVSFRQQIEIKDFIYQNQGFFELKPRTKANIISDFIQTNITNSFSDTEGVTAGVFNDVFGLNIGNELFVRFKKMDKAFKTGNVSTTQQQNFQTQKCILGFPDQPTFVFAGYIPDSTWLNVTGFYIACWDGKTLEWFDEFGNSSYEQFEIKFDPTDPKLDEKVERRIKVSSKIIQLKVDKSNE